MSEAMAQGGRVDMSKFIQALGIVKDLVELNEERREEKKVNEERSEVYTGKPVGRLALMLANLKPEIKIAPRLIEERSRTVVDWGLQTSIDLPGDLDSILVGAVNSVLRQLGK